MKLRKSGYIYLAGIIATLAAAGALLGSDFPVFFRWYMMLLLVGAGFYPLTSVLFSNFSDHGWPFSKTIGIAIAGYVMWLFNLAGYVQFTNRRVIVITLICCGACWIFFMLKKKKAAPDFSRMLGEELIFLVMFFMWTWFSGFHPQASGTEKFMDFGFMKAMERSTYLPAKDIWYGESTINYYYGGQYFGVYMAKLCYVEVKYAYQLLRATVAAFAFIFPFEIVSWMLRDHCRDRKNVHAISVAGGFLAGAAVSLAGNFHYVLYGLLGPLLKLPGYEDYWFPSSTRFIGYNPDTADKCIHEFPSYSFILGDDHAHMINIMFVLTVVAILYAWMRQSRTEELEHEIRQKYWEEKQKLHPDKYVKRTRFQRSRIFIHTNLREPHLIFVAFLIGLFQWTNYWDYVIYLTVALFVLLFDCLFRYQKNFYKGFFSLIIHLVEILIISLIVGLPFTLTFDSSMAGGLQLAENHTPLWQFMILWGLPLGCFAIFLFFVINGYEKKYRSGAVKGKRFPAFFRTASLGDRFTLILGICGFGLVIIPEIVFIRDIYYESGYARSNTMFKLTYQAFILFGMMMAYLIVRLIVHVKPKPPAGRIVGVLSGDPAKTVGAELAGKSAAAAVAGQNSDIKGAAGRRGDNRNAGKRRADRHRPDRHRPDRRRTSVNRAVEAYKSQAVTEEGRKKLNGFQVVGIILLVLLGMTFGYFPYSVHEWFGNVFDPSGYQGLDCTAFLDAEYPDDADAIRWLDENVSEQPIVLEAYGDSYSKYCRVSAMTGLPTVEGWYVHEWLWRMNPSDLNQKAADIDIIYDTGSVDEAKNLLSTYNVEYIFVGSCEREKYPDLSDERIQSFGDVVFSDGTTYIVKVNLDE